MFTGLSGSGKSSLAFDVLYAEGQRRYIDSLSAYARQFLHVMAKPDVDILTGLPPTVAIEQRLSRGGRTSTVATVTEVAHYLRLLFAKVGVQHCPQCDEPIRAQTRRQIPTMSGARRLASGSPLAPVVRGFAAPQEVRLTRKLRLAEARIDGKRGALAKAGQPGPVPRARHRPVAGAIWRRAPPRRRRAHPGAPARSGSVVVQSVAGERFHPSASSAPRAASASRCSTRGCSRSTAAGVPTAPGAASASTTRRRCFVPD